MIQHPAILALLGSSLLISLLLAYAGRLGMRILEAWEPGSGSELQLALERRTYLISAILGYTLAFQILSLFMYIFTADSIHTQLVGAMCAAGSLNANGFGYPVLLLKIANCLLAGVWLIVNHVDNRGYDYPLVRNKYRLLSLLVPLVLLETVFQFAYFQGLRADVITSCCGSLFSAERPSIGGEMSALPAVVMQWLFYGIMALVMVCGGYVRLKGRGEYLFTLASVTAFLVAGASLVSFICLYYYDLPSHHCPFCLLQKEYGHVGYLLYASLLAGVVGGLGVGALKPFRGCDSLARVIPPVQRTLVLITVSSYLLFTLLVSWRMVVSPLRLAP